MRCIGDGDSTSRNEVMSRPKKEEGPEFAGVPRSGWRRMVLDRVEGQPPDPSPGRPQTPVAFAQYCSGHGETGGPDGISTGHIPAASRCDEYSLGTSGRQRVIQRLDSRILQPVEKVTIVSLHRRKIAARSVHRSRRRVGHRVRSCYLIHSLPRPENNKQLASNQSTGFFFNCRGARLLQHPVATVSYWVPLKPRSPWVACRV
jgi:hypothetical protein